MANEERIHGDQSTGVRRLDMAFAELGAEAFEQPALLIRELDRLLGGGPLQAEQALVLGQKVVAAPDPTHRRR